MSTTAYHRELTDVCLRLCLAFGFGALIFPVVGELHAQQPYNPPPAAVLTQRYDNKRTGANLQEHVLTVEAVTSPEFQELYAIPVAGQVYAQPLLVPQVTWTDGTTKNVLIVATMTNSVFAFQVDDAIHGPAFAPVLLWGTSFGSPVAANFMPMGYSACYWVLFNCIPDEDPPPTPLALPPVTSPTDPNKGEGFYGINPWIGILSTPVIDPVTKKIFVVSEAIGANSAIENRLIAIDLITGRGLQSVLIGAGAKVPGKSSDSQNGSVAFDQVHHMQRPALLMQNGQIYIAFGSHNDTRPWHGWIFSYDAKTLQPASVWCSTPNGMGGSIWQAGSGIAGGDDGNIYVMTGNGDEDPAEEDPNKAQWVSSIDVLGNFAEHFIRLDAKLNVIGKFAPSDAVRMDVEDVDLGASGPILFPESSGSVLFGGDKKSRLFVLDTSTNLAMRQIFQAGHPADSPSSMGSGYHHIHGSPVLWRSFKNGMNLYVWPERDYLRKFLWNDQDGVLECKNSAGTIEKCQDGDAPVQQSTFESPTTCHFLWMICVSMPGGILSISADGKTPGTGILWASLPKQDDAGGTVVPGILRAFDADDITHELWNSELNASRDGNFLFAKYNPPVVANGRVYMGTFSNFVNVYGLRQWAKYLGDGGSSPPPTINAGQSFTTRVTFFNSGTTVWKKGEFRLGSQSPQDNTTWGTGRFELPNDVNPGDQVTFVLTLTAPTHMVPGCSYQQPSGMPECNYQWKMVQESVEWFGEYTPIVTIAVPGIPPRKCPSGLKCCETDDYGNCTQCLRVCP